MTGFEVTPASLDRQAIHLLLPANVCMDSYSVVYLGGPGLSVTPNTWPGRDVQGPRASCSRPPLCSQPQAQGQAQGQRRIGRSREDLLGPWPWSWSWSWPCAAWPSISGGSFIFCSRTGLQPNLQGQGQLFWKLVSSPGMALGKKGHLTKSIPLSRYIDTVRHAMPRTVPIRCPQLKRRPMSDPRHCNTTSDFMPDPRGAFRTPPSEIGFSQSSLGPRQINQLSRGARDYRVGVRSS